MRRLPAIVVALAIGGGCPAPARMPMSGPQDGAGPGGLQRLLFYTSSSTDSPHKGLLPIVFAIAAREKGHDASLFFAGDGTLLMKERVAADIKAVGQPGAEELLAKAVKLKIPIHV